MDKSHVGMEYKICPVTGKEFEVGILLDRRLKKSLERKNVTGFAYSPEVQAQFDKGYVALVEIDESKSTSKEGTAKMEDAYRTGRLCYLKDEVAKNIFGDKIKEMNYISEEIFEKLVKLNKSVEDNDIAERENGSKNGRS